MGCSSYWHVGIFCWYILTELMWNNGGIITYQLPGIYFWFCSEWSTQKKQWDRVKISGLILKEEEHGN